MKTKPTPRARRTWANYYGDFVACHNTRSSAMREGDHHEQFIAVPVAVIPLDDVQSLIDRATGAHYNAVQAHPYHVPTPAAMRAALTAIGVLPKQKKGGAK